MSKPFSPLPRLGRRGKILRNLVLSLCFLALVWAALDFPLPAVPAFHRLERSYLRQPSQVVAQLRQEDGVYVVGVSQEDAVVGDMDYSILSAWPLSQDGVALIPIPTRMVTPEAVFFLALNTPQDTVSARLELELSAWLIDIGPDRDSPVLELPNTEEAGRYRQEFRQYQVQGQRLDSGAFLFSIRAAAPGDTSDGTGERKALSALADWYNYTAARPERENNPKFHMTAYFYNADGMQTGQAVLSPQEGNPFYPSQT